MRPVQGVGRCPLPGAQVAIRVHVLGAGRPCVAPCWQGQGRGGRAGEWGRRGGWAVPVARAVTIALSWSGRQWTIWSIFWKQLLDFFTKWPLSGWQRTSQDGIFMIYVTLIRMFDRFLLYDSCFTGDNFLSWLILRVKIYCQFWYWTSAMAGHWITHNKHIVWQYPLPGVWYWRHL